LDEKETLIRVEQQLKDAVTNQQQIIEDLRTIFGRIDREAKIVASLRSDLKSHLDSTPIKQQEIDNRIEFIEERHAGLKEDYTKFKEAIAMSFEKFKGDVKSGESVDSFDVRQQIKDLKVKVEKEIADTSQFQTQILTSLKVTKWVFGVIVTLVTLITLAMKIYEFLSKH
jgi:hypothetical protein